MKKIHESVKIGKYCMIAPDVEIAKGTRIGDFVTLGLGTVIGTNCYIGSYSIIEGSMLFSGVTLQGRNRIGTNCIICGGVTMKYNSILTSNARIGERTFIGVGAVTLGSDFDMVQVGGMVIGEGCKIGGHSLIAAGLNIPNDTQLAANSFLKECDKPGMYAGNPAVWKKEIK